MTAFSTPEAAALYFATTFQESASCVCSARFDYPRSKPVGSDQALVLHKGQDVPLGNGLYLNAAHHYRVLRSNAEDGGYVVETGGYAYGIESDTVRGELAVWHWHTTNSWCRWPHMHVRTLLGDHLPTGRVAFEQVVRWLIQEAQVQPLRQDWDMLLSRNEADWRSRRSWA